MKSGVLYGVGVGPGDPELVTVRGARVISSCPHVFVPKAKVKAESVAHAIVESYISDAATVHELVFPMVTDKAELEKKWSESAEAIASVLREGENACFVTLGDPLVYSTYIYMIRAVQKILPEAEIVTVPGVTSFCAVASLTNFPLGEGKERITIVPTSEDMDEVRRAVRGGGTVVLMKVGKKLPAVIEALEELGAMDDAVFVAHAGMDNQRVETDLRKLKGEAEEAGYLSTILVHASGDGNR